MREQALFIFHLNDKQHSLIWKLNVFYSVDSVHEMHRETVSEIRIRSFVRCIHCFCRCNLFHVLHQSMFIANIITHLSSLDGIFYLKNRRTLDGNESQTVSYPRSAPFIMAHASGCALHGRCLLIILLLGAITNSYYWWKLDVEWMIQRLLLLSIWFIDDKWNGNMNATHSATEKEKTLFIELITVWFSCSVGGKTKHHHHCTCTTIAVDSEWGVMKLLLVYWALDSHKWE